MRARISGLALGALASAMIAAVVIVGLRDGSQPASASTSLDSEESQFVTLINQYRVANGLNTLQIDPQLQNSSEWMSQDMASKNYFSHTDSLGRDPWQRMAFFGYNYNTWKGENLAAGTAFAQDAFNLWRNSPGHNANMLGSHYIVMGIGRAYDPNSAYGWYWTNDFGGYSSSPTATAAPTATPSPTPTATPTPPVDSDGDGVPDAADNCPNWYNPTQDLPPWSVPADDPDCDGFTAAIEIHLGTLPAAPCANTAAQNDEPPPDTWPVDFNNDQRATTQDVLKYIPVLNTSPPDPAYDVRFDLNGDNKVTTQDVLKFMGFLNTRCA
jgi:uncharacterized protein YkwD